MLSQFADDFCRILQEELIPAMGCTEPIALAYAAALMKKELGVLPEKIVAQCSGNMIKNVRCVQIPNSHGMTGIEAAVVLGAIGGNADNNMEVLESVTQQDIQKAKEMIGSGACEVKYLESDIPLHFIVEGSCGADHVLVEIKHSHLHIARIVHNGETVLSETNAQQSDTAACREMLNLRNIKCFADEMPVEKLSEIFSPMIRMNMDIAREGMTGKWGLGIGPLLLQDNEGSVVAKMRAWTCAGSEARMAGCSLPVVINSGSGNQGIASSVPVIVYCREKGFPEERLLRGLAFSSLLTVFQKEYIGKLSAFCGAVSAACASGAAITYLENGTLEQIQATIENTMADIPGIICDGAKISCAAKIASALDASLMAHRMAMNGKMYAAYSGILKACADDTISCVGHIGKVGMRQTDVEIIRKMLEK